MDLIRLIDNTNISLILIGVVVLIILIFLIIFIFKKIKSRKKQKPLSPKEITDINNKKIKIRKLIEAGLNSMVIENHKKAISYFNLAKNLYESLGVEDQELKKGLKELYTMLPKNISSYLF